RPGWVLMGLIIAYWSASGLVSPVWSSLIGDLVPMEYRGRFFGARNKHIGLATLLSLIGAGLVLQYTGDDASAVRGFCAIFLTAAIARFCSAYYLNRYEEPPYAKSPDSYFSFRDFIRRAPKSNFARFVFFQSFMNGAVFVAAPYFTVYMLRDLGLSYFAFMILTMTVFIAQFISMTRWGEMADRYGNKKILTVASVGIVVTPVLWLVTPSFWMLLIAQAWAGFFWAGYNLASANFIFDSVTPPKRGRCAAYQSFINAAFILAGVLIGAAFTLPGLLEHARAWSPGWLAPGSEIPVIIVASLVLRLLVFLFWISRFREVRDVETVGHRELIMRLAHVRPGGASFGVLFGKQRLRRP
ncbi:MAG: MFS transporter, partial [Leptospirales bacterium]